MYTAISVDRRDGFAIVCLNRPGALNALSRAMQQELNAAITELDEDPSIRVMILTGAGRAFCAGLDLKEIAEIGMPPFGDKAGDDPVRAIDRFKGPVIAAVNGAAVTGGFELVLACDVILASRSARFADTHGRVGVLPGWGLSQRLSRTIGDYRARELSLTGRFVSAEEADRWGLVNRVVPDESLLAEAEAMASLMLATSPGMIERLKSVMRDGGKLSLGDALELEGDRAQRFNPDLAAADVSSRREAVRATGRAEIKSL